jgi:hypothetical protein
MNGKQNLLSECPDIEAVNPVLHPKYSPNLYKFMCAQRRRSHWVAQLTRVFRDETGTLWIGRLDDGYLIGANLITVLCAGSKADTWAFGYLKGLTELRDFWPRYTRDGRCAIDPGHRMHFLNDESRWATDGDHRSCRWCGNAEQQLHRSTKVVKTEHWINANGSESA